MAVCMSSNILCKDVEPNNFLSEPATVGCSAKQLALKSPDLENKLDTRVVLTPLVPTRPQLVLF